MLRLTAWLVIALCYCIPTFSQRPYSKGYILIANKLDTLWGYLSFYSREPDRVMYKTLPDEKPEAYVAADLTGFRILEDSFTYISASVPIVSYHVESRRRVWGSIKYQDVFLKPVVLGPMMSLYKLYGYNDRFYIETNRRYFELNLTYISSDQVQREAWDVTELYGGYEGWVYGYKSTLLQLIGHTKEASDYIDKLPYTEAAFRELVRWYNRNNRGETVTINKEFPKQKTVTFFAGLTNIWQSVNVMGRDYVIPTLKGKLQLLPAITAGIRIRGEDRASFLSGTLAAGITRFNNSVNGRRDTVLAVNYSSRGTLLFGRATIDGWVADFKNGSFSAGLFLAYASSWFSTSTLHIKFPSADEIDHPAERIRYEGVYVGLHAQATFGHWEAGAFLQVPTPHRKDWYYDWYEARCNFSGLSLYYHL